MIGNVPQVRVPSSRPLPFYAHPPSSPCPSPRPPPYCFSSFFSPSLFLTSFFFDTYLYMRRCTVLSFQSIPNYCVCLILLSSNLPDVTTGSPHHRDSMFVHCGRAHGTAQCVHKETRYYWNTWFMYSHMHRQAHHDKTYHTVPERSYFPLYSRSTYRQLHHFIKC